MATLAQWTGVKIKNIGGHTLIAIEGTQTGEDKNGNTLLSLQSEEKLSV